MTEQNTPPQPTPVEPDVKLTINETPYTLRMSNRAFYKMSSLGKSIETPTQAHSLAFIIDMIFCMIVEKHPFKTPEDLAEALDFTQSEDSSPGQKVIEALNNADASQKKTSRSNSGLSA